MSAATKLLDRLDGVRQTGRGRWLARCPAHKDRTPSLSVRELDDGRVLLHDFAGCKVGHVLDALGLTLGDLFDRPLGNLPQSHSRIPAADVLKLASMEVTVAALIAADFLAGHTITEDRWSRLAQAAARLGWAKDQARHG
jgi:hypothetical protein